MTSEVGRRPRDVHTQTALSYDRAAQKYAASHSSLDEVKDILDEFHQALPPHGMILDAGCGHGRDAGYFSALGHPVVCTDFSVELLKITRGRGLTAVAMADVRQQPFPESTFDGVWINAVLHHLLPEEIAPALRDARRVMNVDGILYASVHLNRPEGWDGKYVGAPRYFARIGRSDFLESLQQAGLEPYKIFTRQSEDNWIHFFAKPSGGC